MGLLNKKKKQEQQANITLYVPGSDITDWKNILHEIFEQNITK